MAATTLTLVDGARIVVPDSLELITPYVLREQHDWFEDEIKFLRRLLQHGDQVIDIGANYGVYALSMARTVGPAGRVWAFEPASGTADFLAASIAANGFAQVSLERCALSNATGTAQLALHGHAELNALVRGAPAAGHSETVPVSTLDEYLHTRDWRDIAFVKIDAEGEEANILRGGASFFAECSPLVQYEIRAHTDLHMELVQAFAAAGYASYRLVPGLDLLVRFDTRSPRDKFLLNLFCCKRERAADLAARGFLVDPAIAPARKGERLRQAWSRLADRNRYGWRSTIASLPYAARLAPLWDKTVAAGRSREVESALVLHARSRDASLPARERYAALQASFVRFTALSESNPSYPRLASLARIASEYGVRAAATKALRALVESILAGCPVEAGEPFLAPAARFDSVMPGAALRDWVLAAALEELERLGSFSSFYTGAASRERLEMIRDLGFGSAEMQRRRLLLHQRFGAVA